MEKEASHAIWNPETGITNLEKSWRDLAASEVASIKTIWAEQRQRLKGSQQLFEFTERLSREWAIETGIIENLYDLDRGITQTLIERGFQAELLSHGSTNRPRDYVIQLLRDQKDALEGVFDFVAKRRPLTTSYVKELHAALTRSQNFVDALSSDGRFIQVALIKGDWKMQKNYPEREGVVYTYCPPEQVASEMDRLIEMHTTHRQQQVAPEVEAAWLHHRFTQIHPFQDGNGRVARALASLILVQADLFPLVVTRDDNADYIRALESADAGDLKSLIDLIARLQRTQFRKATALSESLLTTESDVRQVLGTLLQTAERTHQEKQQALRRVFDRAKVLEHDIATRLDAITPDITTALLRVSGSGSAFVTRADEVTDHYFKSQIIENAKFHLHYFADTADYRSWVALNMFWQRRAKLVFAFHGIGRPFSGSLVCAPFLEFRDADEDDLVRTSLVPVADEAFVFFYNETDQRALERFRPWRERVLTVALSELTRNL